MNLTAKGETMSDFEKQLSEAYQVAAGFVRDYGAKYLPLFKRLHEEYELLQANNTLEKTALRVASTVQE